MLSLLYAGTCIEPHVVVVFFQESEYTILALKIGVSPIMYVSNITKWVNFLTERFEKKKVNCQLK